MLNFRGGDVMQNVEALTEKGLEFDSGPTLEKDGSAGAMITDPDGNTIYLNTHPDELDPAYQKKVLISSNGHMTFIVSAAVGFFLPKNMLYWIQFENRSTDILRGKNTAPNKK